MPTASSRTRPGTNHFLLLRNAHSFKFAIVFPSESRGRAHHLLTIQISSDADILRSNAQHRKRRVPNQTIREVPHAAENFRLRPSDDEHVSSELLCCVKNCFLNWSANNT